MTDNAPAELNLTVSEGGGDAARFGYWNVTGPQDPQKVYALIELSRITDKHERERVGYAWYLRRERRRERNQQTRHVDEIAHGDAPTLDASVAELTDAWAQLIGTAAECD